MVHQRIFGISRVCCSRTMIAIERYPGLNAITFMAEWSHSPITSSSGDQIALDWLQIRIQARCQGVGEYDESREIIRGTTRKSSLRMMLRCIMGQLSLNHLIRRHCSVQGLVIPKRQMRSSSHSIEASMCLTMIWHKRWQSNIETAQTWGVRRQEAFDGLIVGSEHSADLASGMQAPSAKQLLSEVHVLCQCWGNKKRGMRCLGAGTHLWQGWRRCQHGRAAPPNASPRCVAPCACHKKARVRLTQRAASVDGAHNACAGGAHRAPPSGRIPGWGCRVRALPPQNPRKRRDWRQAGTGSTP